MNILFFSFYRLRKFEFSDFVKGVMSIVRKYDAETLKIEGMVALLLEQEPQVDKLIVRFGKHPLTDTIKSLRVKRNKLLDAILAQMVSVEAAAMESTEAELNLVVPFLRRMLYDIKTVNEKERTERVSQMLTTAETDTALLAALRALGFEAYLLEVRRIQNEIDQLVKERVQSLSVRPRMFTNEIMKTVSAALVNLYRMIELAHLENPTLDYDPLINELSVWSMPYQSLIKGRDTRSENKSETDATLLKKAVTLSATTTATA